MPDGVISPTQRRKYRRIYTRSNQQPRNDGQQK
jgi:hypothetical protein